MKLSVVMSTYNREHLVGQTIESVLNQTFHDFEFIIIDDASCDKTCDLIKNYNDSRIKLFKNKENRGCTFNYHVAQNLAKGKYIAHIDDDDIAFPQRFEKQIEFLENNADINLLGSFIETFGENKRPSWVFYSDSEMLDFTMNFYNPICHSSIMYDSAFVRKNFINYDINCKCAQDYDFYKQFILKGGKLANLNEILVKYRMHPKRLTDEHVTQQIQIDVANKVKSELLSRFFNLEDCEKFSDLLNDFPYNNYNFENVLEGLEMLKTKAFEAGKYNEQVINSVIEDVKNNKFRF